MMSDALINNKKEYYSLTFIILLFIFRTAIPIFKYPFIILYFAHVSYAIIKYRSNLLSFIKEFIRHYLLIFALVAILLLSFLFSNKVYLIVFKDLANILVILSLTFLLNLLLSSKSNFNFFIHTFYKLIILFAIIISIYGITDLYSYELLLFNRIAGKPIGESSSIDYNFALLPVFFGLVICLFYLIRSNSFSNKIVYSFLLIIFSINILLSGSKRGIIIFGFIIIVLILLQIYFLYKNLIKTSRFNLTWYLIPIIVIVSLSYLFTFNTTSSFKIKTLQFFNTKDIFLAKGKITRIAYNYYKILNSNFSYSEFNDMIWASVFNPTDPDTWGTRNHKTIYPLIGENVEIVPFDAKGYLLDNTCNASTKENNAYAYTLIGNDSVSVGDIVNASVFCYVSEDCNVDWVRLSSEGAPRKTYYNLENIGTWQKLTLNVKCNEGRGPVYLYIFKYGVSDFSSLTGHIIFAYPQYRTINRDSSHSLLYFDHTEAICIETRLNQFKLTILNKVKSKLTQYNFQQTSEKMKQYNSSMFHISLPKLLSTYSQSNDPDPIRDFVAKMVSEDTTYLAYTSDIIINPISDNFLSSRTDRWQFALKIFTKEYNWPRKLFGGGFAHLNWFGYYFYNDKTKSDYPHNPFLSILLYSGIFGLILNLYLLYKVIAIYIRYIKEYYILFILFCIIFYFSFFSASNPLDPPVMGFFIMLPFLIDYVYKMDEKTKRKR